MATRKKTGGSPANSLARRRVLIDKALELIERKIDSEQMNASLGDLVRLLEMAGEAADADRQVTARWIDDDAA